jgi:uncharacterized protein (DUF305 family)
VRILTRNLSLAAIALAGALALGACGNDANDASMGAMGSGNGMSGQSSSNPAAAPGAPGDVMFAQMMIPHHQQAVQMADLALNNSTASADVKKLAAQIKAAQDPEIAAMSSWLKSWGAPQAAWMDHGTAGMMTDDDMTALAKANHADFDEMWLTMMIQHHQGAITMGQSVLTTTDNAQVTKLAQSIIDGQTAEIATMKRLVS